MARITVSVLALCLVASTVCVSAATSRCRNGYTCLKTQLCFDRHQDSDVIDSMVMFPCSAEPGNVCCPPVVELLQAAPVDPESNKRLLPLNDCGIQGANRIRNGQEAGLGQFPWMALLAYRPSKDSKVRNYNCGGSLISSRYVLTAAHCLNDERAGELVYVRLGEHDLNNETDCNDMYCADNAVVDVGIEKIIIHKMYNKPYLKNDIALLRLKEEVVPSLYTLPICLPFGLNVTGEENKKYLVAGWGRMEDGDIQGSNSLLVTTVPNAQVSECDLLQQEEVRPINELQLCAGGLGGNDACKGDSGGPLMDIVANKLKKSSKTVQIGIVSFGTQPCGAETPSVYTRVSSYLTWILSNLEA